MEDKILEIEKRLSLLSTKYHIISDTVQVTDNTMRLRVKPKYGLSYILRANL